MDPGTEIREGVARIDFAAVHAWLTEAYWCEGITRQKVERAARGSSLVLSAWRNGRQVGYMRVVSDRTTFAWVADVFVDPSSRGLGIARGMVAYALDHPEHQELRRWVLASSDARGVYAPLGFEPLGNPDLWMMRGLTPPVHAELD